ncbi:MAG: hypothetical protein KIT81_14095 [Alphaproteobacteria bacterium]|nr:hypothetical protein [Alphaproteobacteria bacterium]
MPPKNTVFIQTNAQQIIGAKVAAHSLKRNSASPDAFDVRIMHVDDFPFLAAREGQEFLRGLEHRVWRMDDLQSFTPLRFCPPELMGYQGRAVVIDPDIFAVGDICELFDRDMQGRALMCRIRPGYKDLPDYRASSVMLLDCAKLTHWRVEEQFAELFEFRRDYLKWIKLEYEPDETVGIFGPEWNDFDRMTPATRLLHNTRRRTQPWKTGLPADFSIRQKPTGFHPAQWLAYARQSLFGPTAGGRYKPHPDPRQERFFFTLLRECLDGGIVTEQEIREEMRRNHVRHDALELVQKVAA